MTDDIFSHTFTKDRRQCFVTVNPEKLASLSDDMSVSRNRTIIKTIRIFIRMLVLDNMINAGNKNLRRLEILITTPSGIKLTIIVIRRSLLKRIFTLDSSRFSHQVTCNIDSLLHLNSLVYDA